MQLEEETTGQFVDEKIEAPDVVALPPSSCQVPTSPRHLHTRLPCSHACSVPGQPSEWWPQDQGSGWLGRNQGLHRGRLAIAPESWGLGPSLNR